MEGDGGVRLAWEFTRGAGPRFKEIQEAVKGADKVGGLVLYGARRNW